MSNTITRIGPAPAGTLRVRYNRNSDAFPLPVRSRKKRKKRGGFGGGSGPGTGPRDPQGTYGFARLNRGATDKSPSGPHYPKDIDDPDWIRKQRDKKRKKKASFRGRRNPLAKSSEHCAGALAQKAAGNKRYKLKDVDKQIEKFCEGKLTTVESRCLGARDAKAMGTKYRFLDADRQIAKWCGEAAALSTAAGGAYTPASTAEMVEELYWEDPMVAQTDFISASPAVDGEGKFPILPVAIAGIVLFGGLGLWLTRKKG